MVEARSPSNLGDGVAPLPSSPKTSTLADPEPEPEADLALAPLPTAFDPDAEIVVLPPTSRVGEDELVVPIRSVEDEDAEEAALLESKRQAQVQALGQEGERDEYDDEDDQDLNKILQSLAAGKGEGGEDEMDMDVEVDAEGEELLDEIVAQHTGPEQGGVADNETETGLEAEEKNQEEGIQPINVEESQTALAEQEEREREIPSASGSPLSPLPELPTEFTDFAPPAPSPSPVIRDKRPASPAPESEGETSASGAKRARLASLEVERAPAISPHTTNGVGTGIGKGREIGLEGNGGVILPGKRVSKSKQVLKFDEDVDGLESMSEGEGTERVPTKLKGKGKANGSGRAPAKTARAVNGEGKQAAPRKRKAYSAFSGPSTSVTGPPRTKTLTDIQLKKALQGKTREKQVGPCLRARYTGWGKCTQCIGKVAGDSCRFKQFRMFEIDPKTADIVDTGEFEDTPMTDEMTPLPREFNAPWKEDDILRTERTVASMLLPVISRELRHAINNKAVIREYDVAKHRSVCDFCSSTIFGGYFFCQKCGKDYCLQCERYFSPSMDAMRESPWDLPDAARPRLLRCTLAPPMKGKLAPRSASGAPVVAESAEIRSTRATDDSKLKAGSTDMPPPAKAPSSTSPVQTAEGGAVPSTSVPNDSAVDDDRPLNGGSSDSIPATEQSQTPVQSQDQDETAAPPATTEEPDHTMPTAPPPNSIPAEDQMDVDQPPTPTLHNPPNATPATDVNASQETPLSTQTDAANDEPIHTHTTRPRAAAVPKPTPKVKVPRTRDTPRKGQNFHVRPDLVPLTRFRVKDLEEHWYKLISFVLDGTGTLEERLKWLPTSSESSDAESLIKKVEEYINTYPTTFSADPNPDLLPEEMERYYSKSTNPSIPPLEDPAGLEEESHPFIFVQAEELDNALFDRLWARGEPIVVNGVGKRFKQTWTPDTFIQRFGDEPCFLLECQTEAIRQTSVGKFFEMFKDPEQRAKQGVWKLKDWPSTSDFQSAYPDLYNDFCDSLPVPDFMRREGVLNLYSHFPNGPTRPDIGPKMYNAFEGQEGPKGQGSTRLHMDVADAINIMLYASPRPDGQPGCAVWDLFRAEDADTIRTFLTRKYAGTVFFTDPIHSQVFYLDSELRKELAEKHGVVSFRVYQYPGQAVFIPAGCAHQVCNLADCIKIALDFVSPHNVSRCQQLMNDFRKENYVKAWKDDVLQLYNVMWYSWLNARETRQRRLDEANRPPTSEYSNGHAQTLSAANTMDGPGVNGDLSIDRIRLATQVSSVRDEPTPISQSQSPSQSKEASPAPMPEGKDSEKQNVEDDTSKKQIEDRLSLSKSLFQAMLLETDNAPPPPVKSEEDLDGDDRKGSGTKGGAAGGQEGRMRTTDLVKLGVLPLSVAYYAPLEQMKQEQEEDRASGRGGEGFSLDFGAV